MDVAQQKQQRKPDGLCNLMDAVLLYKRCLQDARVVHVAKW